MLSSEKLKEVRHVARSARRLAEDFARESNHDETLCGLCVVMSRVIYCELRYRGYKPKLIWNGWHAFVTVGGYLVDVTATQFEYRQAGQKPSIPRVVVRKISSIPAQPDYWSREQYNERSYSSLLSPKLRPTKFGSEDEMLHYLRKQKQLKPLPNSGFKHPQLRIG